MNKNLNKNKGTYQEIKEQRAAQQSAADRAQSVAASDKPPREGSVVGFILNRMGWSALQPHDEVSKRGFQGKKTDADIAREQAAKKRT